MWGVEMDILQMRNILAGGTKSVYDLNIRVVDYSRVSTDSLGQATSLVNQGTFYKQLIENTPSWEHVGSYTDDGISGTRTSGRDEFNQMICQEVPHPL